MLKARSLLLATTVAAAALSIPATAGAQATGAEVFTYGQCVKSGFPDPSQGEFGPLPLLFTPNGNIVFKVPPGQLAQDKTGISCVVGS